MSISSIPTGVPTDTQAQQTQQAQQQVSAEANTGTNAAAQAGAAAAVSSGVVGGQNLKVSSQKQQVSDSGDSVTGSYGLPEPEGTVEDLLLALQRLQSLTQQANLKTSTEGVYATREELAQAAAERLEKLEEQLKKIAESKKSGLIGKIFGWIAVALSAIIGAALIATGVGAKAGVALLIVAVATATVLAIEESVGFDKIIEGLASVFTSLGLDEQAARIVATVILGAAAIAASVAVGALNPAGGVALAGVLLGPLLSGENLAELGIPEEVAGWLSLGIQLALAVTAIAVGIGSGIANAASSTSNAATSATSATGQTASTIGQTVAEGGKLVSHVKTVANGIYLTGQIAQAGAQIGAASANIAASAQRYEASLAEADAAEFLASLFALQQAFEQQTERISDIQQQIEESNSIITNLLASLNQIKSRIATPA